MVQKPEGERDAFGIARAGKRKWGYDVAQVDAFLDRAHSLYEGEGEGLTPKDIQGAYFDMRRDGYEYEQVDAALDRLERAVVDKQTAQEIAEGGRIASKANTENLFRQISGHAKRAAGERFAPGKKKEPSYDRKQVDQLIDRIVDHAARELRPEDTNRPDDAGEAETLNAGTIAHTVFTQRKGAKGYDERQVDYYLGVCTHMLTRIESFARVSAYTPPKTDTAPTTPEPDAALTVVPPQSDSDQRTEVFGVSPLFTGDSEERHTPPSFAPETTAGEPEVTFDALHKAEEAIFAPSSSTGNDAETQEHAAPQHGANHAAQATHATPATSAVAPDTAASGNAPTSIYQSPATAGHAAARRIVPREHEIIPEDFSDDSESPANAGAPDHTVSSHYTATPDYTGADAHTGGDNDHESSLAALAHMAEVTHTTSPVTSTGTNPRVPSLPSFSLPDFVNGSSAGSNASSANSSASNSSASTVRNASTEPTAASSSTGASGASQRFATSQSSRPSQSSATSQPAVPSQPSAASPASAASQPSTSDAQTGPDATSADDSDRDAPAQGFDDNQEPIVFPSVFSSGQHDIDLNIPDLSFPTFTHSATDDSPDNGPSDPAGQSDDGDDRQKA